MYINLSYIYVKCEDIKMLNTLKNFKWFCAISIISILLGLLTFITFINQKLIFLNEDNLQYLLILDVTVLVLFLMLLVYIS